MTAFLLYADGTLMQTGKPWIKAADAAALADALAVLAAVRAQAETRGRIAEREGFAAGEATGRADFAASIAALAAAESAYRATQEAEVARLALAALRHIAGAIADDAMTVALARRAAQTVAGRGPIQIDVAPDMARCVEERLGAVEAIVSGDPRLEARQCRITAPDGHVVADLETQIAAIEQRWSDVHGN